MGVVKLAIKMPVVKLECWDMECAIRPRMEESIEKWEQPQ